MNPNSAKRYFQTLKGLFSGEKYTTSTNDRDADLFLHLIERDFGKSALKRATKALEAHLNYEEERGKTSPRSVGNSCEI